MAEWELFYWGAWKEDGKNHMIGRGEFVRLMFAEAGVAYKEVGREEGAVAKFVFQGGNTNFPIFAPPVIRKGDFVLAQTPTIMRYLGRIFNMYPSNPIDEAHADQIMETMADFLADGRLSFHPVEPYGTYYKQIEEAKVSVEKFSKTRLPRFLSHFEALLAHNSNGQFAVGSTLTYADIALFHALCATESQFNEAYISIVKTCPHLVAFKDRIASRPNIAAYLSSDKRGFFEGNSMM